MKHAHPQRGAAILTAMLVVTLVASLSAAALWQQWRGVEVETAERARLQSAWILHGALDWARLILREDARAGNTDHLGEPWAVPLKEARLSSFIAADHSSSDTEEDQTDAFLSGQISDLQSRLNISNLVQGGEMHKPTVRAFVRLYSALHLPESELLSLIQNLRLTQEQETVATSNGYTSLMPHNTSQLGWLGLSSTSIKVLQPYVVVLPEPTTVNLNTAPALVLFACIGPIDRAGAQRLVAARAQAHFRNMADVTKAAGLEAKALDEGQYSLNSLYFEVSGRLRMGTSIAEERSVVQRDGLQVKVLWRERGALAPATSVQSQPIQ